MVKSQSRTAEDLVIAAGLEVYHYADRCGEECAFCRRITRATISGGPNFCPSHAQRAVDLHLDFQARRAAATTRQRGTD